MTLFKKGQVVYIHGLYEGIVEEDNGTVVLVKPLEGVQDWSRGKTFTYARFHIRAERIHKMKNTV